MSSSPVLGIDVDGVLNPLHDSWTRWYNETFDDDVSVDSWTGWGFEDFSGNKCSRSEFFSFLKEDLYFDDEVLPYDYVSEELDVLRAYGFGITFVTSCGDDNRMAAGKLDWLIRHGIFREGDVYYPSSDKANAPVDVLFDDGMHNVKAFRGQAVLVRAHHNRGEEWYPAIEELVSQQVFGAIDRLQTESISQ